jgi:2-hydroxycyclohexanecarboxyl-CoA dehydrogenase
MRSPANIPPGSVMNTIMSEANRDRFQIPIEVLLKTIPGRRMDEPVEHRQRLRVAVPGRNGLRHRRDHRRQGGRVVT